MIDLTVSLDASDAEAVAAFLAEHDPVLGRGNYHRLARATGYSRDHIGKGLQGKVNFSIAAAQTVAEAAGVGLTTLLAYIAANTERVAEERRSANGGGQSADDE